MNEPWTPTLPAGWELAGEVEVKDTIIRCEWDDTKSVPHRYRFFTIRKEVWANDWLENLFGVVDESGRFGAPSVMVESCRTESLFRRDNSSNYQLDTPAGAIVFPMGDLDRGARITLTLFAPEHSPNTAPFRGDGKWYPVRDASGQPPYPVADIFGTLERLK